MSTLSPSSSDLLVDWAQHGNAVERRQVRFNENVKYRIVEDTSRMSTQEIYSMWYQQHECQEMRRDMKKTVKRMAKGYPEDNVNRSYRGLEHLRSRDVLLALQAGRERLLDAVLLRQDKGATPHDIALTATQLSKSSRDRALWYGKNDAEEAKEIGEAAYMHANATLARVTITKSNHSLPRLYERVSRKIGRQCLQIVFPINITAILD